MELIELNIAKMVFLLVNICVLNLVVVRSY